MVEALSFEFMRHALLAALLVSAICGIVGPLIVSNRMVFLAGGIAHTSYGGVGVALFLGIPVFLGASVFAVAAALLIAYLSLKDRKNIEIYIGLIWAVGISVGVVFVDLTPGYHADLMGYLFGSILAVDMGDIYVMIGVLVLVATLFLLFYKQILAVGYDPEFAQIRGMNVSFYHSLVLLLASLGIVVSIKVVGLILVLALLTIPVYIARGFSKSLFATVLSSSLISFAFTLIGLFVSYAFNLTSGATIILTAASFMVIFSIYTKASQRVASIKEKERRLDEEES